MKSWLVIIAVMLLAGHANAEASMNPSAQALVKDTSERILAKLREENETIEHNPARVYELVDEIVLPHFDFAKMSSWVLGRYWRKASPEQKQRFTNEFRQLLVRTYSKALADNKDSEIIFHPLRAEKDAKDVIVRTEVEQDSGFPLEITYSMYLDKQGAWKVYDVNIDGISLVANYRTSFSNEIRQSGLDELIAKLEKRNQQAANE
jgi:phospholipid transport system substrate-binding protein